MVPLRELLGQSDYISLNCDLNPSSFHLIDSENLSHVKASAVIINTARGPVIEEQALIDALQRGVLHGAALDVFEEEPLPADSPLLKMEQVLLAPHNANSSPSAWGRIHLNTIANLFKGLELDIPQEIESKLKGY
jgi:D-3-phosphoglycerate dehydrogenase